MAPTADIEITVRAEGESVYQGPAIPRCSEAAGTHRWELQIGTDLERARVLGRARAAQEGGSRLVAVVRAAGEGRVVIADGPIGSFLVIRLLGRSACPLLAHR